MTGDRLYDRIKDLLSGNRTPQNLYLMTKLTIRFHLMEKVERVEWRWKRVAA